ncbi:MAG: pilus assembly protein TadG-related protein [Actinomycetota bacterium]
MTIMALGLALVAFAVSGVAVDGTRAFLARRTLQNAADASALAGASELDRELYYASSGTTVALDPDAARRVALEWLARCGVGTRASVLADTSVVRVALHDEVATSFLGLMGIQMIPVTADASAEPLGGSGAP